jgi:Restriction endonuclease BglII
LLDPKIRRRWTFLGTSSAAAVLRTVCPAEWADITSVLETFELDPTRWMRKGGNRGDVAKDIDGAFFAKGWREIRVDLSTQGSLRNKKSEVIGRLPAVEQEGTWWTTSKAGWLSTLSGTPRMATWIGTCRRIGLGTKRGSFPAPSSSRGIESA